MEEEAGGGSHRARELGPAGQMHRAGLARWCMPAAGPTLPLALQRSVCRPCLLTPPSLSPRVKLAPLVLVAPKALKVLAVNLALLGPPGRRVPP